MSINLSQVLDYLDTHPVCQRADTVDSVMELLCEAYAVHNEGDAASLEQEQQAFSQGVVVGMFLMTEVNSQL